MHVSAWRADSSATLRRGGVACHGGGMADGRNALRWLRWLRSPTPAACLALYMLRAGCAWACASAAFAPDEYWQAAEPAHRLAFGYGTEPTWEWRPDIALRSHAFVLPLAAVYRALSLLHLDAPLLVRLAPRLLFAGAAAASDVAAGALADAHLGGGAKCIAGDLATLASLLSWMQAYAGSRSLAGSAEAPLCALAAASFATRRHAQGLAFAAVACAVRPTAAVAVLPAWVAYLTSARGQRARAVQDACAAALVTACVLVALDSALYGRFPCFAPLAFVRFNLLSGGASAFGTHGWHWYATSGLPQALFTLAPLAATGVRACPLRARRRLLALVFAPLAALSLCAHKEVRFVQPLMPALCVLAGVGMESVARARGGRALSSMVAAVALSNAALALYLGSVHQSGQTRVVTDVLAPMAHAGELPGGVHFLTACYSSPGLAHVHAEGVAWRVLDCAPTSARPHEDDRFFEAPERYMENEVRDTGWTEEPTRARPRAAHPTWTPCERDDCFVAPALLSRPGADPATTPTCARAVRCRAGELAREGTLAPQEAPALGVCGARHRRGQCAAVAEPRRLRTSRERVQRALRH